MTLFAASLLALILVFAAMAVGVLAGRAPLRPGCAGAACEACTRPCPRREAGR